MSTTPSTVSSLWESAGEVLLIAEDAVATTVGGAIERSYVAPSEPSFDCCPMLSVYVQGLAEGGTLSGPGGLSTGHRTMVGSVILATYVIHVIRCAPTGGNGLPSLAQMEASAREVQEDGWAVWNRIRSAIKCGEIFGECQEVFFDGETILPEQGGCVGWQFLLRASIDGIIRECQS